MQRGLITVAGNITTTLTGNNFSSNLTPEDIRFYLMYWDKLAIPANNLVYMAVPNEEDLIKSGVLWRPTPQLTGSFSGAHLANSIIKSQSEVASLLLKDKSTDWVVHQTGSQIILPSDKSTSKETLRVTLSSALPTPSEDVHINEILEFKAKREDELLGLHSTLDELYVEVLGSPDVSLASKQVYSRLESAIENLNKVSDEKFNNTKKFDLSTELNLTGKDIAMGSASGAIIDSLTGFTLPVFTCLGALGSCVKIQAKTTNTLTESKDKMKLAYLSQASKSQLISI